MNATDTATITAIGAAVVPLAVSFLKRENWSASLKQLVAGAVSLVVAVVGIALSTRNWSAVNLTSLAALAYGGSQIIYSTYFRGSVVETKLASMGNKKPVVAGPVSG
jgi:hypothetical protein